MKQWVILVRLDTQPYLLPITQMETLKALEEKNSLTDNEQAIENAEEWFLLIQQLKKY